MTDDTKQMIQLQLSFLKHIMKKEGVIFSIVVDRTDFDNSRLCFLEKESLKYWKYDGITISLQELNKDLLQENMK